MKHIITTLVLAASFALCSCVKKSELEAISNQLAEAKASLAQAQESIRDLEQKNQNASQKLLDAESEKEGASKKVLDLKSRVEKLSRQLEASTAREQVLTGELNTVTKALNLKFAEKPEMPVRVTFRTPILGNGEVAVFETTVKQNFPVLVTVKSAALGTQRQHRLDLNWQISSEIGYSQGSPIMTGDEIVIQNSSYKDMTVKF